MRRNHLNQSRAEQDFAWLNLPDRNAERYAADAFRDDLEDVARAARMTLVPGYRLVRVEEEASDFVIVLLCDSTQEIAYSIHCDLWEGVVLNGKPLLEVRVWRTGLVKHHRITSGLAEAVFRLYLLERYRMIASACTQIFAGREFWIRQLGHALAYGGQVYRYNPLDGQLLAITDHSDIVSNACDLWGDATGETVLAIFSQDVLHNVLAAAG